MSCRWTPAEDAELTRRWAEHHHATIRLHLPGRTWVAIRRRANELGIADARWQGYVSLTQAAAITGFTRPAFVRLLTAYQAWWHENGDKQYTSNPGTAMRGPSRSRRIVDAQAAVEAAEWWLSQ